MEDPSIPETETGETPVAEVAAVCPNCGQRPLAGDYPTPLCGDCRTTFTRFPIPLWIKCFAGGILALLVFSLIKFPADLAMGIRLEKGKKYCDARRYLSAERELKPVADRLPRDFEANGSLLIAAFYNDHFALFADEVKKISDLKVDDEDLFQQIDQVMTEAVILVPTDSFSRFSEAHPIPGKAGDAAWQDYFSRNAGDDNARLLYAHQLFNSLRYRQCDSIGALILNDHPGNFPALLLAASTKRLLGQDDSALVFNERMLAINRESVSALSSEARTLLRMKRDGAGLTVALKACALDPDDRYAQTSLILAYHFNGRSGDRDALIRKAQQQADDSSGRAILQYGLDVISKKEKFRN